MQLSQIALTLFLVANPIGNTPACAFLVKSFPFERQRKILFREAIFSFIIAVTFLFVGGPILEALHIKSYALSLTGGTILFILALKMIFPPTMSEDGPGLQQEPFIVPIAIPLVSGGGVLSTVMIFAEQEQNTPKVFLA
ncbi:MAG TPA: MarC family protein, partial [Chlamydiales bacterium]|nr:MarC family protein [Chlamydiales bacterium]